MNRRRARRRGVSLVEVGVFLPIALMVIGLVWTFFSRSAKTSQRTDAKLQGVQSNLLLAIQLERDLESLYETPQFPVGLTDDRHALKFFRCKETSPEEDWDPLPIEEVVYRFDKTQGKVFRQVDGGTSRPLHGFFERVHFHVNQPKEPDEADPRGDLPLTSTITFWAIALPEADFRLPPEKRDPFRTTTIFSEVSRRWNAGRFSYPYWNPVPYYPKAPAP